MGNVRSFVQGLFVIESRSWLRYLPSMKPLLRAMGCVFLGLVVASMVAQNEPPVQKSASRPQKLPSLELREVPLLQFRGANSSAPGQPGETDCNSPLHWDRGTLFLFNSAGQPWRSSGGDLFDLSRSYIRSEYTTKANGGRWIECTWKADDGMLYGWYHHEPVGVCPEKPLTVPGHWTMGCIVERKS